MVNILNLSLYGCLSIQGCNLNMFSCTVMNGPTVTTTASSTVGSTTTVSTTTTMATTPTSSSRGCSNVHLPVSSTVAMSGKPVLKVSPLAAGGLTSSAVSVAEIVRSVTIPAASVTTTTAGQPPLIPRGLSRPINDSAPPTTEKSAFYLVRL